MKRVILRTVAVFLVLSAACACHNPARVREGVDDTVRKIVAEKQMEALGHTEPFRIDDPVESLRRRLLLGQNLPRADEVSLGSSHLEPVPHWPEPERKASPLPQAPPWQEGKPLRLGMTEALQVAARHSRSYQSAKEEVFRSALVLELERDVFRPVLTGVLESEIAADRSRDPRLSGAEQRGVARLDRRLKQGASLMAQIGVDLVKLLTLDRSSSLGIFADASVSIPLLRGAGKHIASEPLTLAEREMVYSIWNFERFRQGFAVEIASGYLGVLQQLDEAGNAEENYRQLVAATRRARRFGDAGRLPETQVDQAVQDELQARDGWISARQEYARSLDRFKSSLGLPPDASVELDRRELDSLHAFAAGMKEFERRTASPEPADAPIVLPEMDREGAGPFEMEPTAAVVLALERRLDLKVRRERITDAQRAVVVAADALRADLTLLGAGSAGERRTLASADATDARLRPERGRYSALLHIDLPLERTAEEVAYRNSFIALEQNVRSFQELEDEIKLQVRSALRDLAQSREEIRIQKKAVALARRRVESTGLFLRAGRGEIRDLLEAYEDLLSARDDLSAAVVRYRVAELELQRDTGVLEVDEGGTVAGEAEKPSGAGDHLKVDEIHFRPGEEPMAVVNGLPVMQGMKIGEIRVDSIAADGVRFTVEGKRIEVPLQPEGGREGTRSGQGAKKRWKQSGRNGKSSSGG